MGQVGYEGFSCNELGIASKSCLMNTRTVFDCTDGIVIRNEVHNFCGLWVIFLKYKLDKLFIQAIRIETQPTRNAYFGDCDRSFPLFFKQVVG